MIYDDTGTKGMIYIDIEIVAKRLVVRVTGVAVLGSVSRVDF